MKWFFAIFLTFSLIFLTIFGVDCFYGIVFPVKFEAEISAASQEFGVEKAVIFSVINVESHFNPEAVSSKGAVGLMQVMPTTAQTLQEQADLKDPKENIFVGTKYLAKLVSRFENLETALCAYNAGPTNVSKWLQNKDYSEDGKTLKKIPFEETRNYIQKFRKNLKYYQTRIKK